MGAPAVVGARGAEQAAAAAAAAYAPVAAPVAVPAPVVPPRPPASGTVYTGTGGGPDGRDRFGRRRAQPGLRIGAHTASDRALELLGMAVPGPGLVLGYDVDQTTASIRLFRPEPTRVALVGGEWACHVLALRALALGARVAVFTTTPERWDGFGEWATGRTGRVATFSLDQSVVVPASAHEPALLLYDAGLTGVASNVPLGPWQTRLTVLRQLTSYGIPAIQEANMVLAQRLSRAETEVVTSTMRLSSEAGGWMQTLNDDALAVIVGGEERYVRLTLATLEQQLGVPRR
jgi:hypothetical protein